MNLSQKAQGSRLAFGAPMLQGQGAEDNQPVSMI
jgi:hypothetical protein